METSTFQMFFMNWHKVIFVILGFLLIFVAEKIYAKMSIKSVGLRIEKKEGQARKIMRRTGIVYAILFALAVFVLTVVAVEIWTALFVQLLLEIR